MSTQSSGSPALEPLLLRTDSQGIVTLRLNRPGQFNALSEALLAALQAQIDALAGDASLRCVVLEASGRAFSAGHDLREMRSQPSLDYYRELFRKCGAVMQGLQALPVPVIAKVRGIATAAGCQLVASCDLAICADDARFAVSGINVGLFCATPAVALSRNVSAKRAFDMLVTGRFIDAATAADWGLVNDAVPADQLDARVAELAAEILSKSPAAIRHGKRMFYKQRQMALADAYDYAGDVMARNMMEETPPRASTPSCKARAAGAAWPERPRGSGQPAHAQPPAAAVITTHTGDQRAYTSRPNSNRASPKSAGPRMADVHTGSYRADSSTPTTAAFTPASMLRTPGRRRSPSQNGIAPASSKAPGRKIIASMLRPLIQPIQPPAVLRSHAQKRGKGEQGPRHGLRRAIARQEIRLRHHAAGHRRGFQHGQHHMPATENQRAGPVEACELRGQGRGGVLGQDRQADQQGREQSQQHPSRAAPHALRRLSEQGRGGSCSTAAPTTAPRAMAASCPGAEGKARVISAAAQAMPARIRSGQSVRPMPHTACAMTATAATFRPWITAEPDNQPKCASPRANSISAMAEGSVNASQAASMPAQPARFSPIAMPTWLLAGPGRNWHSATRSE